MRYKIFDLCGIDDYECKVDSQIDLIDVKNKLISLGFEYVQESRDFIRLKRGNSELIVYKFGDIIGFKIKKEEFEYICRILFGEEKFKSDD